jgi:hypothetical protein
MQAAEVRFWITQSVRVVNPDPIKYPACEPVEDECVSVCEDLFVLCTQTDESVDIEKAPVSKLLLGSTPESESIVLALKKGIEHIWGSVGLGYHGINGRGNHRLFLAQARQLHPQYFLIAVALADRSLLGCARVWEPTKSASDKGKVVRLTALGCGAE